MIDNIKILFDSGEEENKVLATSLAIGLGLESSFMKNPNFIKFASNHFECPLEYIRKFGGILVGSYSKDTETEKSDIDFRVPMVYSYALTDGIKLMAESNTQIKIVEDCSTYSGSRWASGKVFWYKQKRVEIIGDAFVPQIFGTRKILGVDFPKADRLSGLIHSTFFDSREKNPKLELESYTRERAMEIFKGDGSLEERAKNLYDYIKNNMKEILKMIFPTPTLTQATLFGGDRYTCCDDFVTVEENDLPVGIATIAPEGEQMSGTPTIVGVYIKQEFRGKGLGLVLTKKAIERCIERGFTKARIDCLTTAMLVVANKLKAEYEKDFEFKVIDMAMPLNDMFFV